jgi:hypothetical protein
VHAEERIGVRDYSFPILLLSPHHTDAASISSGVALRLRSSGAIPEVDAHHS